MDRRLFLKKLGFVGISTPMIEPLMAQLRKQGIAPEVEALLEPVEAQKALPHGKLLEIYQATLRDMGIHNEAIDRLTGKWQSLEERRDQIRAAKEVHANRIRNAQRMGKIRRREQRKHNIRRRIKILQLTRKPKLP